MATFSVIIATRNRPALFSVALNSVIRQSLPPAEIIVVDDGSDESYRPEYARALDSGGNRVKQYFLVSRPRGHGAAYARNFGASRATGDYLCFLDDDDSWSDFQHLQRANAVIEKEGIPDLHLSNQRAFLNGEPKAGPIWIENLIDILRKSGERPDEQGAYAVTVDHLMRCTGFCHLNTLIVRRDLFERVGGLDESIRWEEDRDLFLRLIDRARLIKHSPEFVSRHNIPDPAVAKNQTTSLSEYERRLSQLRVFDKAVLMASHASIRAYGRKHKAYTLKRLSELLAREGRHTEAAFYAREALGAGPTCKWAAYTLWRAIQWAHRG